MPTEIVVVVRINAYHPFVNVDLMLNAMEVPIRVQMGYVDVVKIMNAQKGNIVTLENANVCD